MFKKLTLHLFYMHTLSATINIKTLIYLTEKAKLGRGTCPLTQNNVMN